MGEELFPPSKFFMLPVPYKTLLNYSVDPLDGQYSFKDF